MHYRSESEGVPWVNVSISYTDQDWYTTLTRKVTPIIQLEERALVAAGMSMLWAPQNPRAFPVYGYKGIGDDVEDETDVDPAPTREEPILLSSEESAATQEPFVEGVSTPVVDLQVSVAEQAETRKKKKEERTEGKTAEEPVAETPRKRPSNSSALDYVLVSDTLSGLDAGFKRASHDPDDDATLTEMMKKRKILEDKKCELDAQATAVLSEKKSKFMGPTAAPSESEVDLGVFSKKTGNRLEKIFKSSSTPRASSRSARSGSKIDISKITPPTSPPSAPLDLSPPRPDPKGKGKEDDVEVDLPERVVGNVVAGAGRTDVHTEGVETEWESSEATPPGTVYTKRVRGSGGWILDNP
ncbi:hypothetical protein Hanom_Chr08g00725381 [Helianthus anomalus]